MPKFFLHYIDPAGDRHDDLTDGFDSLDRAKVEATRILEEIGGGDTLMSPMGFIEIVDQSRLCVWTVRFPEF